jgi:hypothetical protein
MDTRVPTARLGGRFSGIVSLFCFFEAIVDAGDEIMPSDKAQEKSEKKISG